MVTPRIVKSKDNRHRMGMNASTVATDEIAPNSNIEPVPVVGELVVAPTPVVKMSMSCWMR